MSIENHGPSATGPVDHWYQLHLRIAEKGIGFPGAYRIFGPMNKQDLLGRVEQIINCEPDADGEFAHSALVVRVEVQEPCHPFAVPELAGIESVDNKFELDLSRGRITAEVQYRVGVDLNRVTQKVSADLRLKRPAREVQLPPDGPPRSVDQPIIGYRTWAMNVPSVLINGQLVDGEPQLFGANWFGRSGPWEWGDSEVIAQCLYDDHRAPALDCTCGLYAHHGCLIPYGKRQLVSRGCFVEGTVLGTGNVLIYNDGWRAEFARVIGFSDHGVHQRFLPALHQLARKFDVPVVSRDEMWRLGSAKGRVTRKSDLGGSGHDAVGR